VKRLIVALCCIFFGGVLFGGVAIADQPGGTGVVGCGGAGSLGNSGVGAGAGCGGEATPTTTVPRSSQQSGQSSAYYYWQEIVNNAAQDPCPAGVSPATYQLYGPSGPLGAPVTLCPSQRAQPPPAPPSPVEALSVVPWPVLHVGVNPAAPGLAHLPSWFWVSGPGQPVSAEADADGYTVSATATPVAYSWNFGDGAGATSSVPGSQSEPSTIHTFAHKGTYSVGLSVEWQGSYTFSGNGISETAPLGDYYQDVTVDYVVQEVRSVLVPTGA